MATTMTTFTLILLLGTYTATLITVTTAWNGAGCTICTIRTAPPITTTYLYHHRQCLRDPSHPSPYTHPPSQPLQQRFRRHHDKDVFRMIQTTPDDDDDSYIDTVVSESMSVNTSIDDAIHFVRVDEDATMDRYINNNNNSNNQNGDATNSNNKNIGWSIILLNLVAVIWGTQHAVIKGVVVDTTTTTTTTMMIPAVFTLLRFTIAALLVSPYTPPLPDISSILSVATATTTTTGNDRKATERTNRIWRWGMEMGIYMFLGFSFQAIGLQTTTAQRSGFLLYLNVKFVPFLAFLLYQRPIRAITFASALVAFTGTALLAYNSNDFDNVNNNMNPIHGIMSLNTGDIWTIAAAVASAMFILRLETASQELAQCNVDEENGTANANFNAASLWIVAFLSLIWTVVVTVSESTSSVSLPTTPDVSYLTHTYYTTIRTEMEVLLHEHFWELVYLGGVTTAFANYIQTRAQRYISAERASIIYAMDPVYGAFFSYLILGETFQGITAYIGAAFIVAAAATNAMLDTTTK